MSRTNLKLNKDIVFLRSVGDFIRLASAVVKEKQYHAYKHKNEQRGEILDTFTANCVMETWKVASFRQRLKLMRYAKRRTCADLARLCHTVMFRAFEKDNPRQ
jgi:hypothetical protein